jgi:hypothetical protein
MAADFKVGDQVRWVNAVFPPEYKNAVGTIVFIVPSDTDIEQFTMYGEQFTMYGEQFTMYDIKFLFGTRTLYSTHIETA